MKIHFYVHDTRLENVCIRFKFEFKVLLGICVNYWI